MRLMCGTELSIGLICHLDLTLIMCHLTEHSKTLHSVHTVSACLFHAMLKNSNTSLVFVRTYQYFLLGRT